MKTFITLFILVFSLEGHVSQVVEMPEDMLPKLDDMITNSDHILVLKSLGEHKEYYKKVFPKSTHHQKAKETIYTETVYAYKVAEVLKSSSIKAEQKIWLWTASAYGEESYRLEHEQGVQESPYVSIYKPNYKVEPEEKLSIYYLQDLENPKQKETYLHYESGIDGMNGLEEIKKLIPPAKP